MRALWPPIEVIASNLQSGTVFPLHFPDKEEVAAADHADKESAQIPAFIRDKIRKRVASRMAQFDTQPRAGQIWRFDGKQDNSSPLCVLLDEQQDQHYWQGWLVAAETDYATHQDVLLEPKDEPFDPVAGMVQTWNPVRIDIRKGSRVLAQLAVDRLNAIREVAKGQSEKDDVARPGFVAPLKTNSGATILAGTCINHPEDPRHRYQSLYRTAAEELERQHQPAQLVAANDIQQHRQINDATKVVSLYSGRKRIWQNVGWGLAASVVLAQAAIIVNLIQSQPDQSYKNSFSSEYRAVPQPASNYTYLEVNFKPETKEIDIRKLLTQLNASIVDGPGEFGQYRVQVKTDAKHDAISKIKASGLVDSVTAP